MSLLSQDEITKNLSSLSGWMQERKEVTKQFLFKDFAEALNFVNKVGAETEKLNHHPDIFIHSWNQVKITISTHSEGGITTKDFQLAEIIEGLK